VRKQWSIGGLPHFHNQRAFNSGFSWFQTAPPYDAVDELRPVVTPHGPHDRVVPLLLGLRVVAVEPRRRHVAAQDEIESNV
jgi:hypothetical protein